MNTQRRYTIIGILIVIGFILVGSGMSYNAINQQNRSVKASWSQVENVMQRRYDLTSNLVATVRGSMQNEQKIFGDIASARRQFDQASSHNEKLAIDDQMNASTRVLVNAVTENYPDLKSSEAVQTLMSQLEGSENRISVERRNYINEVKTYNTKVTNFPMNLVANMFNFHEIPEYKAPNTSLTNPSVSLEFNQ